MTKGEWGNIQAYFDLTTAGGFTIKGFRIINGSNGLFVGFPSVKDKEGEYNDTIWCDKQKRQEVNEMAINHYNSKEEGVSTTPPPAFENGNVPF